MHYFTTIEDTKAVIVSNGAHYQVDVYRRGNLIYVRKGGAFLRCMSGGGTSVPSVLVEDMDEHPNIVRGKLRLEWKGA